jgi:hypothetical protein
MDYQPITSTREYSEALTKLQEDVPKFIGVAGLHTKTTVRLPKPLVDLIVKRGDMAYESVKRSLAKSLGQFCEIGDWSRGKEGPENKRQDYIQFKLIPERVEDEA